MPIVLPPSVNYPSPLNSIVCRWDNEPSEGNRFIPCEVDWATMGGADNAVSMQLYGNAAQTLSQILALSVDNSGCGADVQFVFPDTSQVYTIPAYEPACVLPVFTNALSFYVICPNAATEDVTRFSVHNSLPPPSSLSVSKEQNIATSGTIASNVATSTQVIPLGVNGTIEALSITAQLNGSSNAATEVQLIDGNNIPVWTGQVSSNNSVNVNLTLANLSDLSVRFNGGLTFKVSTAIAAGAFAVNVYYRTP
jgi:hypothetical protein